MNEDQKKVEAMMLLDVEYKTGFSDPQRGQARIALWLRQLERYTGDVVMQACDLFMRDPVAGRFDPKIADVVGKCELVLKQDGRPGVEEAWAIAIQARDEAATVVWTQEIAEAFGAVRPLLTGRGDETPARMAFKEAYHRLVDKARDAGRKPMYFASLGTDATARDAAIERGVRTGLLPAPTAQALLMYKPVPETATRAMQDRLADALKALEDPRKRMEEAQAGVFADQRMEVSARKAFLNSQARRSDVPADHGVWPL